MYPSDTHSLARFTHLLTYLLTSYMLAQVRVVHRVVTWEDPYLTFTTCLALAAITLAFAALGQLLVYMPWGLVFEWSFRLAGAAP
jgi:hypothetical protein